MYRDVGIADQQKAEKQGRDDSINSSVYNPTLHIFPHWRYVQWSCVL